MVRVRVRLCCVYAIDAQTAAMSIGSVAVYAKAAELQEFGDLKFGKMKRNRLANY